MKKALFLALIYASSLSAMNYCGYGDVPITIENKCEFPISVTFDAYDLHTKVTIPLSVQKNRCTSYVIAQRETEKAYFPRLAKYNKNDDMLSVLSRGRADIKPALTPLAPQCFWYFNSSKEKLKLIVSDQDGKLTVEVEEMSEAQ